MFHESGQLAEELATVKGKKRGTWLKFFHDGTPELQAEYVAGEKLIVHHAWNEKRQQVVKDGTGIFRDDPTHIDWEYDVFFENGWPRESELKEGIPHGKVTTYCREVLWSIAHYARGKPNGESTTYWDNGRIRSITEFVAGKDGESKKFPKFDHPMPAVVLSVKADEKLYTAWRHICVDEYRPSDRPFGADIGRRVRPRNRVIPERLQGASPVRDALTGPPKKNEKNHQADLPRDCATVVVCAG